jgi:hypothetical protein
MAGRAKSSSKAHISPDGGGVAVENAANTPGSRELLLTGPQVSNPVTYFEQYDEYGVSRSSICRN